MRTRDAAGLLERRFAVFRIVAAGRGVVAHDDLLSRLTDGRGLDFPRKTMRFTAAHSHAVGIAPNSPRSGAEPRHDAGIVKVGQRSGSTVSGGNASKPSISERAVAGSIASMTGSLIEASNRQRRK